MSGNSFGEIFRVTTFGESHGPALGVVIDGVPAGIELSESFIQSEMNRRRPGQSKFTTQRNEADRAEILSGVFEGKSTGTPIAVLIRNSDQHSKDYSNLAEIFRPGHADYTYFAKYGIRDYRGGGRSSGRETAARVAAGAVAKQLLSLYGVKITGCTVQIGKVKSTAFDAGMIEQNPLRCADAGAVEAMQNEITAAASAGDSVGGMVECRIEGVPAGLGEAVFDKFDAVIAHAMLSIGGVKSIEFGDGCEAASMLGSENNDQHDAEKYLSNHAGGVLGGMTTGETVKFRMAVKPTPSIRRSQRTFGIEAGKEQECLISGRHDPCLCPRIVPVMEAMAAIVTADMLLRNRCSRVN